MKVKFTWPDTGILLFLIIALAAALRFTGLDHQSMWVDELHTMREADPSITWRLLFDYLKCCDQHPPLYFAVERILFTTFGYTELVARSLSALLGTLSVYAMFLLGKELLNARLGLITALLTSINYFNIEYSQEARCYIMAFLFSVLSYLYFVKLIKDPARKYILPYALFTLLMLYSHYFAMFVLAGQGIVVLGFLIAGLVGEQGRGDVGEEHQHRRHRLVGEEHQQGLKQGRFFTTFAISGALILAGFLPWLPFVLKMSQIKSFWITPVKPDFAVTFILGYFGNLVLAPLVVPLLLFFFWKLFQEKGWTVAKIKSTPLQLTVVIFFTGVATTYLIPYIRSVFVVPMLLSRYTIVVLPAFILAIAFSFTMMKSNVVRISLLTLFVVVSLVNHVIINQYYSQSVPRKTQFRELTQFMAGSGEPVPIIEERSAWQHAYYLNKYQYQAIVLPGRKEAIIDSILTHSSAKYNLNEFWIVGAHFNEPHLEAGVQARLDVDYERVENKEFFDCWAERYRKKE